MTQVFHRSFNVVSKASIFGGLFIVALIALTADQIYRSPYVTNAFVAVEQPVPFSHEHHVRGLGIDCRYCHTTVETSAFAGLPPTKTCMNCHSQIWTGSAMLEPVRASLSQNRPIEWNRVHSIGGFAYFDHSIHVNKGVGCASCHGRIDQMPLTWPVNSLQMEWCLKCHREPEKHLRPKSEVFNMNWTPPNGDQLALGRELVKEYNVQKFQDCSTCHH